MRTLRSILRTGFLGLLAGLLPTTALAVDQYPTFVCTGFFGCGRPPEDVVMLNALPTAGGILIQVAAAAAVIAIVVAGVQMVVSYADEGKITNARKAILYALGGLGIALSASSIVAFVTTENYGQADADILFGSSGLAASAIRIIMILSNVAFVIVVILAGVRMITAAGNADEFKKAGKMIQWAIIGAVVVNLARVLVHAFLLLQL